MTAPAASLRGGAVGALTVALAVAAHGMAGGGYPSGSASVFLAILGVGVGAMAALPLDRFRVPATVGGLMFGQLASHIALVVGSPHEMMHGHSMLPSPTMSAFHIIAAVATAALLGIAESLYGPITSIVRAVLDPPLPLPRRANGCLTPVRDGRSSLQFFTTSISRRGPPMSA